MTTGTYDASATQVCPNAWLMQMVTLRAGQPTPEPTLEPRTRLSGQEADPGPNMEIPNRDGTGGRITPRTS
jgi:hypothetical protein